MTTPRRLNRDFIIGCSVAFALAGCVDANTSTSASSDDLLGGVATNARPEIGSYSGRCTATLFAPQWVITAGHCTGFQNVPEPGDAFIVTFGLDGRAHTFSIDFVHTFGALTGAGDASSIAFENTPDGTGTTTDVAIAHLATAVPESIAIPAVIGDIPPADGTTATVFGFGCQNRSDDSGGGFKQAVTYISPSSDVLCPGDSGGPIVIGEATDAGAIIGVNTGFWSGPFSSHDVHGEATYYRDEIMSIIRQHDGTSLEFGFDRPGDDLTELSEPDTSACQTACVSNSSCRSFTFVGASGSCFLKSAAPDWISNQNCPSCTSGIAPQAEAAINRPGSDLVISPVLLGTQPVDACIAQCGGNELCAAYTYVAPTSSSGAQCWLKGAAPAGSPAGANLTSGVKRGLLHDVNLLGGDWSNGDVSTVTDCETQCSTQTNCRAFTFTPTTSSAHAHCWLKSSVPQATLASGTGFVSGVKRGLQQNTNFGGGDTGDTDVDPVPEACQARCASTSGCVAFTYTPPGFPDPSGHPRSSAHCWLKGSVPGASSVTGLVSGVRGAEFF